MAEKGTTRRSPNDEGDERQREVEMLPRLLVLAAHEDDESRHQRHRHDQALDQGQCEGEDVAECRRLRKAGEHHRQETQVSHAVFDVVDLEDVQDRGSSKRRAQGNDDVRLVKVW